MTEHLKLNSLAISHMINVLGTKPAKKDTLFSQIKRIGVDENLILGNNLKILKENLFPSKPRIISTTKLRSISKFLQTIYPICQKQKKQFLCHQVMIVLF